jgi:uroporphyrinogen III methyltransferase/synthase
MAVRWGTRPDQDVLTGTLESLGGLIHEHGLKPPATIVVGDVVSLRAKLSWYEKLPLHGQRVVVTRAREQAGAIGGLLRALGAEVIELPTIEIQPARDYSALDGALANLNEYDWLIFTSANGVRCFFERLDLSAADVRSIRGRICAIGPATREWIERSHLKVDVTATEYVAEGLLEALRQYNLAGARILIARAAEARDVLPRELTRRGARVDVVEAYRTVAPANLGADAASILTRKPDWIAFTSSSTARNLAAAAGPSALEGVRTASIGPVTSATLRELGIPVTVEASVYTVSGLVDAILAASIIGG